MIARARSLVGRAVEALPESLSLALRPARYRYDPADRPPALPVPDGRTRLLIGRANFAAQGYRIARAAERLDGVGAVCLHVQSANRKYAFPSDVAVPAEVFQHSAHWRRETFRAVTRSFTHVIIEAGRPMFGKLFDNDPLREIEALRAAGVSVALLAHGSELRLPSRHREVDRWSPFRDDDWADVPILEAAAIRFRRLAERADVPVFVSTPDQLADWPSGIWVPLSVEPVRWRSERPVLEADRLRVVHAPTNPRIKGTHLIEPVLERLDREGLIEYQRLLGLTSSQMPEAVAGADVVIEQFRIGTYSVAAVEAMAAGRLVIVHLHDQVQQAVLHRFGRPAPVLSSSPDEVEHLLRDVAARRSHYRDIAARGPSFVEFVHDGAAAAATLKPFLSGVDPVR